MKIRSLAIVATSVLALGVAACGGDDNGGSASSGGGAGESSASAGGKCTKSITVGLPVDDSSYAPLYLAVDRGLWKKEGLNAKLVAFSSGSDLGKAVIGGSVEIADSALSEMILAVQQRQPVKAFWGGMNMLSFSWWARPPIKNVQQVKGKKWGVTKVGSSTDFMSRYFLSKNGLDPEADLNIVGVGPAAGAMAAIKANQIQVATASQPAEFQYQDMGYAKIGSQADFSSSYPTHVSYSRTEFQEQQPGCVAAYLRGVVAGTKLALSDRKAAEAAMVKHAKVPQKYVGRTYDANKPGWAVDGALPPQKDMDVFWQIGIQAKQFGQKLPEERWLNRKWLDAYPNLGSAGGGQQ